MNLIRMAKASNFDHWRRGFYWLLAMGIGTMLPVWGGFLILSALGEKPDIAFFLSHGEFYIYSASLLSASIYIIVKRFGVELSFIFSLILIISSAILYAIAVSVEFLGVGKKIDENFLIISTAVIFPSSLFLAFTSKVKENILEKPGVSDGEDRRASSLENRFDKMGGKKSDK